MACCAGVGIDREGSTAESMISKPFRHKDKLIGSYRRQLRRARWAGRIVGATHSLSSFLAFCNLTWATVVLLGAYVNNLVSADYYIVFSLLLVEATRLASAAFFSALLTRVPQPGHFSSLEGRSSHHHTTLLSSLFRLLYCLVQALLIVPSFVLSIHRFTRLRYPLIPNLQTSLRIFYSLVIANASISAFVVSLSSIAWIYFERLSEKSILQYYDQVLNNTLTNGGAVKADDFNFFLFAFRLLGRDYASYKSWQNVVKDHKRLLRYLYAHKQGADYLYTCLEAEDAAVRQAAANTVGAWVDGVLERERGEKVELPVELMTKLADMVGTGEVGWAAVCSFGALARTNPRSVMKMLTSDKHPVLERIAELIDGSSTRSLASVRTLVFFYDALLQLPANVSTASSRNPGWIIPDSQEQQALVQELKLLLENRLMVQRLRLYAAYLLYLLDRLDAPLWACIIDIAPKLDAYWYEVEKQMLDLLLAKLAITPPDTGFYPDDLRSSPESVSPLVSADHGRPRRNALAAHGLPSCV